MPRPPWKIDRENRFAVIEYLEKHFKNDAGIAMKITSDIDELNKVVHSYMSKKDLSKMRAAIRKAKSRDKNWRSPDVNLTLKPKSHNELRKFVENYNDSLRDGQSSITLSEAIYFVFDALNDSSLEVCWQIIERDFINVTLSQ